MHVNVYLSGEIHSNWRKEIVESCSSQQLPITFMSPVIDHNLSDNAGDILAKETDSFWGDHKSAKINGIRTRTMIEKADIVVVKFGEQYRQWNAAFEAGYAVAKGKPIIVLHPNELGHPLKEVDAAAMVVAENPEQVTKVLKYILTKQEIVDSSQ